MFRLWIGNQAPVDCDGWTAWLVFCVCRKTGVTVIVAHPVYDVVSTVGGHAP